MALAVILTPIFNAARGSILIPMLFHFLINGPMWPEAQPWENYIFAAVAVIIVLLKWGSMTTRDGAAIDVLCPAAAPSATTGWTIGSRRG